MIPAVPTTLTATAVPAGTPPRVDLALEWTGATEITVSRQDPDGRTRPVRNAEPATLTADLWSGADYESWFGTPTVYEATDGVTTITATAVTLAVDDIWLRHPGIPSLSQLINFEGWADVVRPVNQAVIDPLGRKHPIVITDGKRRARRGQMRLRTYTEAELESLLALLDDASVLLLDLPPALDYGITHHYLALGDLTEDRFDPGDFANWWRIWQLPFIVVDRPAGGDQAVRTWATVMSEAATWADLIAMYDDWADVLTGTTS